MKTKHTNGHFKITLLHNVALWRQGKPVELKSQKGKAILAYLLLNSGARATRDRISDLLWSKAGIEKARTSLRQVIHSLKTTLNLPQRTFFHATRNEIRIDLEHFDADILAILRKLDRNEIDDQLLASKRIAESLLPGFDDLDPEFRVWLAIQRQTLHDRIMIKLEENMDAPDLRPSELKKTCQALLNLDPTHEGGCLQLMRIYAKEGDIASALRVYKSLWSILDEEYGMEPSQAVQELAATLKLGEISDGAAALDEAVRPADTALDIQQLIASFANKPFITARDRTQKLLIAVEPFEAVGGPGDQNYILQGFRHELIACLIRFRDWTVIDLKTAQAAGTFVAPGLAQYTISTSVYPHNGTLTLVLTLLENASGIYIWSDRFELSLNTWFLVQNAIVRRMALALNVNLSAQRLMHVSDQPDVSLEIYDRWLRAEALLSSFKGENHQHAALILRSIIESTPGFPDAYFSLVVIENTRHLVNPGLMRSQTQLQEGLTLARTAVQLDPLDSHGHLCLAWSLAMTGQYDQAAYSYAYACNLNENDPWTLISSAHGLASCGKPEQALKLAEQSAALDLQPSPAHWGYQCIIRFIGGDYRASVAAAERAHNAPLTVPAWKTAALYHLHRHEEATVQAKLLVDLVRSRWAAPSEPHDLAITRWLLQCTPLKRREDWHRLQAGLQGAGLAVPAHPEF